MISEAPQPASIRHELGSIDTYTYLPSGHLKDVLAQHGRDPRLQLDGLYLRGDRSMAVGVIEATAAQRDGRFKGWSSAGQVTLMEETAALLNILGEGGQHANLAKVREIKFNTRLENTKGDNPFVVNVVAKRASTDHHATDTHNRILSGDTVISEGKIVHDSQSSRPLRRGSIMQLEKPTSGYHFDKSRIETALKGCGYDVSEQFIDDIYFTGINAVASMSTHASEGQQFSPFNLISALEQTIIFQSGFFGQLAADVIPRFTHIDNFDFKHSLVGPMQLTIKVNQLWRKEDAKDDGKKRIGQKLTGLGTIYYGVDHVASGQMRGSAVNKEVTDMMSKKRKALQQTSRPLFPLQP